MTKDQAKRILKVVIPVALAIGAALGYVDENCTCEQPPAAPAVNLDAPDAG